MDKITELEKLQNMEIGSSNYSRHKEFLLWAECVGKLISPDQKLLQEFTETISRADSLFRLNMNNEKEIEDAKHTINKVMLSINKMPNITTTSTNNKPSNSRMEWFQKPIGYIGMTVVAGI